MELTFLGTKGYIDVQSKKHKHHSSLLITHKKKKIMIDCGESWLKKISTIAPHAIVITHAHPDHAFGLIDGAPCPVYATGYAWQKLKTFPIEEQYQIYMRRPFSLFGITFEAFPVIHSLIAPAVGYRISYKNKVFFYVPDVVWIKHMKKALQGIDLYIGDGATIQRVMVRKKEDKLFGHANVRQQLTWCKKHKVKKMIITHCGSDIVSNESKAKKIIEKLAKERNVEALIAYDGYTFSC